MTSKEIMTGRCREDELWQREIALQLALMNEMELARRRSQEMIDAMHSGSETSGTFLVTNGPDDGIPLDHVERRQILPDRRTRACVRKANFINQAVNQLMENQGCEFRKASESQREPK